MRQVCWTVLLTLSLLGGSRLGAQLPTARLDGLFPAGAKAGTTFDLVVSGTSLDDLTGLQFSHPGLSAQLKFTQPGPFDKGPGLVLNTLTVTCAADVPLGVYEVRTVGRYGVSNPRRIEIGDLPELLEVEPNNDRDKEQVIAIPCILNGRMDSGGDQDRYRFSASASQRILIDCRARRIDSRMDAVLALYDLSGRLLAESRDQHQGDPLIDFTSPSGGEYIVRIVDSLYGGGGEFPYRLRIGALTQIDAVFPPAAPIGSSGPFTIFGRNLPGGVPSDMTLGGHRLESVTVNIPITPEAVAARIDTRIDPEQSGLDLIEYKVRGPAGVSNSVFVAPSTGPVTLEVEPNNVRSQPQAVQSPCDIAGRFYPERDQDWFRFEAKKGEKLWIEVISQRAGAPTDCSLYIRQDDLMDPKAPVWAASITPGFVQTFEIRKQDDGREQLNVTSQLQSDRREGGAELDIRSSDPSYLFTPPADGTYTVQVKSGLAAIQADLRATYRLVIRKPAPDFRLVAIPVESSGEVVLRQGGREAIRVVAHRLDGFTGEIALSAEGLPAGVTCAGSSIGPSSHAATLVLECVEGAAVASSPIVIRGKSVIEGKEITQTARPATLTVNRPFHGPGQQEPSYPARVAGGLVASVVAEPAPIAFSLGAGQPIEISRAGQVKLPYSVVRRGNQGNLTCFWDSIPVNFNQQQFNVDGGAANGEFQFNLPLQMEPGTYSLSMSAFVQNVQYARNPEAAKAAQERKTEFEKIIQDEQAATKTANDAKSVAEQASQQADQVLKQTQDANAQAIKALEEANAALKVAAEAAAQAKKNSEANPGDANLAQASANAVKAAEEATAKVKAASDAADLAKKTLEEADAKAKTQAEVKAKAIEAARAADARFQLAQQTKQKVDELAQRLQQQSQPQNVNFFIPSTNITLKVHPAPLTISSAPPAITLKQGESNEFAVQIARLFGFADGVNVSISPPPAGAPGVQFPNGNIPGGQNETKLKLTINPDGAVGEHACILRLQFSYNGQGMQVEQPLKLTIEKAPS
jgi:hypothetical protein